MNAFIFSDVDASSINPALYRHSSMDTGPTEDAEVTMRFSLRFEAVKEWAEVRVEKVKGMPVDTREVTMRSVVQEEEEKVLTETI